MPEQPDPSAPPSPVEEASKDSSAPSGTRQSVVGVSSSSSASSSKAKPLESPEYSIPGHDMLRELNRGGMGAVYKARQHGFNRIVAVKVILPERLQAGEATKRFGREVRAAALLHHPNFVMVFQTDLAGPVAFLTMEYVDGIDLSRLVKLTGPLPIQLAVSFIVQAADALQHAADKGVIHRDIKPSNLMVTPSPVKGLKEVPKPLPSTTSAGSIKILDLGLARILGDGEGDEDSHSSDELGELTQAGEFLGTPDYMAPEQAENPRQADTRSDLYSLGATLYYLLAGQPVFAGGTIVQKLRKHLATPAPLVSTIRPDVPVALAQIIDRLLRKKPEDRFQKPAELAEALRAFLQGKAVQLPNGESSGKALAAPIKVLPPLNIRAHGAAVSVLVLSDDGKLLATGGLDETVKVWDAETGRPRRPISGNEGALNCLAFHPEGNLLAGASSRLFVDDMGIHLWDLTTGREVRKLTGFQSNVQALRFDPKGRHLITGCENGEVRLFPLGDPNAPSKLLGRHPGGVLCFASLSSTRLISAGGDGNVIVWDLEKCIARGKIGLQVGPVKTVAVDRAHNLLLAGGQGLLVRDGGANCTQLLESRIPVRSARFILAGTAVAAGCEDGHVRLIDTNICVVVEERQVGSPITSMEAVPHSGSVWIGCADGTVRRLDPFSLGSF